MARPGFAKTAIAAVILCVACATVIAEAASFDFTLSSTKDISGEPVTATANLQATPNASGDGSYTAIGGTIFVRRTEAAFSGTYNLVLNPDPPNSDTATYPSDGYDNQLYPSGNPEITRSDSSLFQRSSNPYLLDFTSNSDSPSVPSYELPILDNSVSGDMNIDVGGTLTAAKAVPEPDCLYMFGIGLFGLMLARFRKRPSVSKVRPEHGYLFSRTGLR
jgi:hypothetical protein